MAPSMNAFITRDDEEIPVSVDFSATRYYPATWDDPAEGGEIEIEEVHSDEGKIELSPEEHDALTRWLAENFEDDQDEREYEPRDDYNDDY